MNRRQFIAGVGAFGAASLVAAVAQEDRALIAVSFDLEMSRNFPKWEDTHWDYEKGNLDEAAKAYTVGAATRVKAAGGVLHCFAVGRTFEQENVTWLKDLVVAGHPVGNHTYDHVNVLAAKPEDIQFRFKRSPWLIDGMSVAEAIDANIAITSKAIKTRLGIDPMGFRTPGGFTNGLHGRDDLQRMLLKHGFTWISAKYPAHTMADSPTDEVLTSIVRAQAEAQPFVYPSGLIEVPMSPVSDIGAFRNGRWPVDGFHKAVRLGIEWAIENRACFDFLAHPSCLGVVDPDYRVIDSIGELVRKAGKRAALVSLDALAARARR